MFNLPEKELWLDEIDKIAKTSSENVDKELAKASKEVQKANLLSTIITIVILALFLYIVVEGVKAIVPMLKLTNTTTTNYTLSLKELNRSTTYNSLLVAKTIGFSYASSLSYILLMGFSMMFLFLVFYIWRIPSFSFGSRNKRIKEWEFEIKKLGSEHIARVCKRCAQHEHHNKLWHEWNMLNEDYYGERHFVVVK